MLGPRMGHRQGLDKQTRDRFAPTRQRRPAFPVSALVLNPHGILMGPQGQAAWAARRPPMTMDKPSRCIGPASFRCCKLALLLLLS